MAAPPTITLQDISGVWVLDKNTTTNNETDEILAAQGVGWMTRKIISAATVTLNIKNHDKDAVEFIDIETTLTGGIQASPEHRELDYEVHDPQDNRIYGEVCGRSKRMTRDEITEKYAAASITVLENWLDESFEHRGGIIVSEGWSNTPKTGKRWGVIQVWGLQSVNGERKYTRIVYFEPNRPDEGVGKEPQSGVIKAKMVYNYVGPLP